MAAAGTIRLSGPGSGCAGFGDIFTQPGHDRSRRSEACGASCSLAGLFGNNKNFMCRIYLRGCLVPSKMLRYGSAFQRFLYLSAYIRQILSNKKIEKYYDPVRDGTECVIPLGTCFCMATVLVFLEKWIF